jgi:2-oxoglutarate ferredoxin oxidoreductase subunit gamma
MHKGGLSKKGVMVYDEDLVEADPQAPGQAFGIPATRLAEELGRKIVSNIVMLGFFGAVSGIMPKEALRQAVETSVPEGTQPLNLKAFDTGYEYGEKLKQGKPKKPRKAAMAGSAQGG